MTVRVLKCDSCGTRWSPEINVRCPVCRPQHAHLCPEGGLPLSAGPEPAPPLGTCSGHLGPPNNTHEPHALGSTCLLWKPQRPTGEKPDA